MFLKTFVIVVKEFNQTRCSNEMFTHLGHDGIHSRPVGRPVLPQTVVVSPSELKRFREMDSFHIKS